MKKRNVVFDFDSTLVSNESLNDILKIALGDDEEKIKLADTIVNDSMAGKIPFKESLDKRLKLTTINKSTIDKVAKDTLNNINEGVIDLVKSIDANYFIVSGGFLDIIKPVAELLNIKNIYSNEFIFDKSNNVAGVKETYLLHPKGKSEAIKYLKRKGIMPDGETIMIGDGYTDLEVLLEGTCDKFICFAGVVYREEVAKKATFIVKTMKELKNYLQK